MKGAEIIDFTSSENKEKYVGSKLYNMQRADNMDDLLKAYIEKVDRDQSDLREDIRESEKRTEHRISEMEGRMDSRLERIERMIEKQGDNIQSVEQNVNNKMDENKKFMCGIVITILLSIVASIGVIVATYFSTISLLQDMLAK